MLFCANDESSWRLSQLNVTKKINKLLYSRGFLPILSLLAVIGHVFEIEMCIYWIYAMIAVYMGLFGKDFLLLLPLTINCYIMPSPLNNPGKHAESIFYMENGAYQFMIMAGLIALAFLFRWVFDREIGFRNVTRVNLKLLGGLLALGAAYLLSGLGSKNFVENFGKNLLFAALQFIAVFAVYFILSFTVKWKECDDRYFFCALLLMGAVIGIEILNVYRVNEVIVNTSINKSNLYTGWGVSINIGMMLAMAIPGAFYLIHKGEGVVFYNVAAILLCLVTVLTTSRAAILGVCALYGACALLVIWRGKTKLAKRVTLACAAFFFCVGFGTLLSSDIISYAFSNGLQSESRLNLYRFGFELFLKEPVLGNGFFSLDDFYLDYHIWDKLEAFSEGFPDRWHNTVVQLLASCGLCGLGAYVLHRYQTVKLFVKRINDEKIFIAASVLVLLAMSLVDCHFFNIGPTLVYSGALAFAQGSEERMVIKS